MTQKQSLLDQVQRNIQTGKMDGSWIITGGYDHEKKRFALDICSMLFKQNINEYSTFHPDIKWLECSLTDEAKRDIQKTILAGKAVQIPTDAPRKRDISVDDVREGIQFLSLKPGENGWRVLIINPADKMNESAANALLKVLEEPSLHCVILLLCQNMGKLLPTIKSRCRKMTLAPMTATELSNRLHTLYPALSADDLRGIISLSDCSLGLARDICEHDGVALYQSMRSVFTAGRNASSDAIKALVDQVGDDTIRYQLLQKFILDFVADCARENALTQPFLAEDFLDIFQELSQQFSDIKRISLDKNQVLQAALFKVAGAFS